MSSHAPQLQPSSSDLHSTHSDSIADKELRPSLASPDPFADKELERGIIPPPQDGLPQIHSPQEQAHEHVDVPPNGGYGWVIIACNFLINAHTWGLNSSYSIFLAYYLSTDAFAGASSLSFALIGGLSISQAMLISPVATTCIRLFGTHITLLVGVMLETASFIGASFSHKLWQLILSQGLCFGWGMGFLFVGSVSIPSQWFTTRRSLANAVAAAGSGMGGLMYSLATQQMIQSIGLPWAFRVLGIVSGGVNLVCAALLRDRNRSVRARHATFDHRLLSSVNFLLMSGWAVLSLLGYIVLIFSLANYAASIGLTAHQGSVVSAILNLGQVLGRPPIGYFSDAMGRLNMAAIMTLLCGLLTLVVWTFAKSYGVLIFFALVGGTVAGTFWATVAPVAAEVFNVRDLPSVLNLTWLMIVLPTTFSEAIALEIVRFDGGDYLGAQIFTGFMYVGGAAFLWVLRARKLGEVEIEAARAEGREARALSGFWTRLVKWRRV